MCRKNHNDCTAKVKCKCCVKITDKEQKDDKLNLNEVDNQFEQHHYIIEVKGE